MKFTHVPLPEAKYIWKRKNTPEGRFYVAEGHEDEFRFPSITTVLSCRNKGWLREWRAKVGEAEANRVSRIASRTGTQIHKACENYLNNIDPFARDEEVKTFLPMIPPRFNTFKALLDRIDNVLAQEVMMASVKLGLAGTVDCVGDYEGVRSIIDFKTSKRPKTEEQIKSYMVQETAYAVMFYETYGIPITNLVTLISVENGEDQVFISKPQKHIEYLKETIYMFNNGLSD